MSETGARYVGQAEYDGSLSGFSGVTCHQWGRGQQAPQQERGGLLLQTASWLVEAVLVESF